jgi:hypothetical protein
MIHRQKLRVFTPSRAEKSVRITNIGTDQNRAFFFAGELHDDGSCGPAMHWIVIRRPNNALFIDETLVRL